MQRHEHIQQAKNKTKQNTTHKRATYWPCGFFFAPKPELCCFPYLKDSCIYDCLATMQVTTFQLRVMVLVEKDYEENNAGK